MTNEKKKRKSCLRGKRKMNYRRIKENTQKMNEDEEENRREEKENRIKIISC